MLRSSPLALAAVALALLTGCHARVSSFAEQAPPPPEGSGNVTINMEGGWRIALSLPIAPVIGEAAGTLGLAPPRVGSMLGIAEGEFALADGEILQPEHMPDADDWKVESYVNVSTGSVAYYRLIREHKPNLPALRQEVGMVVGAVDDDRMLAFVQFTLSDTSTLSSGTYLIDLHR